MAGSRRSPVLRDQWRTAGDAKHHRNRDRQRPRGSRRDRGRGRPNDRRRPPSENEPDLNHPTRSPPPSRPFPPSGPEESHGLRGPSPGPPMPRDSPGPHPGGDDQGIHPSRLAFVTATQELERRNPLPPTGPSDRRRDHFLSGPPPKRKRTRSPSPRGRRRNHPKHGGDRNFPSKKRGRFSGRGRPGRRSPRRGRDRREDESVYFDRSSRSPHGGNRYTPPRPSSRSPAPDDFPERDSRYRSASPHSFSGASRGSPLSRRNSKGDLSMNSTRPFQSVDDSARSPSPPRPIPSFDADVPSIHPDRESGMRDGFPTHTHSNQRPRSHRSHIDTRPHASSPQYVTPGDSHHGTPQPTSPYSSGRGGRGGFSHHGQHG